MILPRFSINCVWHYSKITLKVIMSRKKIDLSNLKNPKTVLVKQIPTSADKSENSSPYFSPLQTRNQRKHLQIKYEKDGNSPSRSSHGKSSPLNIEPVKGETHVLPVMLKKGIETKIAKKPSTEKETKKRKSGELKVETKSLDGVHSKMEAIEEPDVSKQAKWMPKNWEETLENLRVMRLDRGAPVDTMGCHKCADPNADSKTQRYHNLIALMLSSQTKDQTTYDAMQRLKAKGLTPQNMVQIETIDLEKLLCPVSFYKTKAKNIQKASHLLIDQYDSDIPPTVEELVKLPGVGPKMAHICMKTAWNVVSGIGVDTHVHRISNRLKWVPKPTKEPEQTRIALEKWVPFEIWSEVNEMMVGFGQTICTPTNPKCDECLNLHCPSRVTKKK